MPPTKTKPLVQASPSANTSSSDDSDAASSYSTSSSEDNVTIPVVTIPTSTTPIIADEPADDEESDDENDISDIDKDGEENSPPPCVKPVSTKLTSPTKINLESNSAPPSSSQKRPAEKNSSVIKNGDKKARKEKEKGNEKSTSGFTPRKVPFQRLWNEDDEIILLKGLIEFQSNRGVDPILHADDFFDSIKPMLSIPDIKKDQTMSKVRKIRQRFINSLKKKKTLIQPNQLKIHDLCNKVWGDDGEYDDSYDEANGDGEGEEVVKSKKVLEFSKSDMENELIDVERLFSAFAIKQIMKKMDSAERVFMKKTVKKANVRSIKAYLSRLDVLTAAANKMLTCSNKMLIDFKKN